MKYKIYLGIFFFSLAISAGTFLIVLVQEGGDFLRLVGVRPLLSNRTGTLGAIRIVSVLTFLVATVIFVLDFLESKQSSPSLVLGMRYRFVIIMLSLLFVISAAAISYILGYGIFLWYAFTFW